MPQKPVFPERCPLCGAPVEVKRREIVVRGGVHAAVFEALVGKCTQCGETFYTPDTVQQEFTLREQLQEGRLDGLQPVGQLFMAEAV